MQQKNKQLTQNEISRYTIRFWKIIIGIVAFGVILLFSIGLGLFGPTPSFRDLENPKSNQASEVISSDGVQLGGYYVQNRSNIHYNEISPNVINALIATEDTRFYSHSGIDFRRTFTIIFYNLIGKKQGASTISQQLALNLFSDEGRSRNFLKRFVQKLQEWITAVKLERKYTKEEIITMYLNTVDFGTYNSFGIKAAAKTFYNVSPGKLSREQAAVLVGMLKGPTLYSPIRHPENALSRRNFILGRMADAGYLSDSEVDELRQKPLNLHVTRNDHNEGLAPYFRTVLKKDIQRIFEESSITKSDGTPYDLDRDGLNIYTTINSKMQRYAEEAQREYLKDLQKQFNNQWKGRNPFKGLEFLITQGMKRSDRYAQLKLEDKTEDEIIEDFNKPAKMNIFTWRGDIDTVMRPIDSIKYYKLMLRNSIISVEPDSGYVRAWVGGIDFEHFKYDQVKMGTRQVGSTAKPFTYAVAIGSQGYSPCYQVLNEPVTITGYGEPWTPRGGNNPLQGMITLKTALAFSQNYTTAYMMKQVGATAVATQIKKMGITSKVQEVPSIALGSFDASLYDMAGAYSAFVNHGVWTEPTYITRIEDKNGNVLYEKKPKVKVVLDPQTAYAIVDMLKGAVDIKGGTGGRLRWRYNFKTPMGGKTGTTQNNSDGWFMGITPKLVTGVWTGCEDRALHFISENYGEGANSALPIFALYMKKVYADPTLNYSKGDFEPPAGGVTITLDCNVYSPRDSIKKIDMPIKF